MMVIGTLVPWVFFLAFIAENGVDINAFIAALFSNGAASGFTVDLLLTSVVFWAWSFVDSQKYQIAHWWVIPISTLFVGLSLALPLYLWLRHRVAV
jgi:hypothetical protein